LLLSFLSSAQEKVGSPFEKTLEIAKNKAKKSGKGIFVLYYADWCGFCEKFQNEVLTNEIVAKELTASFESYRVLNSTLEGKHFKAAYSLRSLPTLLFFDREGNIKTFKSGFEDIEQFRKTLRNVYQYYLEKDFPETSKRLSSLQATEIIKIRTQIKIEGAVKSTSSCINGSPCDDGDPNTINDICFNGICAGKPVNCDDNNICTTDTYNPSTGQCEFTNNTASCNDGNACTTTDACSDGVCVGSGVLECNDNNPCTDDTCDTLIGCVFTANNVNTCSDNSVCTNGDFCQDGSCISGTETECPDDGNLCTTASCDPMSGCGFVYNNNACDDGNASTINDVCINGVCTGSPQVCDDGNPCTTDSYNATTSQCEFVNNTASCNDGNACTTGDACSDGVCVGGSPLTCEDNDRCTTNECNPASGCFFPAIANNLVLAGNDFAGRPPNTIIADSTFNAINYIGTFQNPINSSNGNFQYLTIQDGVSVQLFASKAIVLNHGFEATNGATFTAKIEGCSN
jgi:thioredoxin-related protein